ncbi:MAG: copper amine oxidase N-terminal domain-containing protein [Ruminococcaceae bacterium]|nr:copper amine oxidase N-terminal domain-containing protein [Oscillospiraceae bacterium]
MKKLLSVILVAVILLSCVPAISVSALETVSIITKNTSEELSFSGVLKGGRTLVPAEDIAKVLEATLTFNEETKTVTIAAKDRTIICTLVLDSTEAKRHGSKYTLDVPVQMIDSEIMVPVRFVAESFSYTVDWVSETKTVIITKINLIPDAPDSEGKKAVIARARQLTEFTFTPLKDMPAMSGSERITFEAGKEYKGIPYTNCESNDKYVGENVSLETFISALANPDSVLYTKDLYGQYNGSTYYGVVCNCVARYSLDIKSRYSTEKFLSTPGMKVIGRKGKYTADDIELCDVLHAYGSGTNHVALITGLLRNEAGEVVRIEVSEGVKPSCKRRTFDVESFFKGFGAKYTLLRYDYVDTVPAHNTEFDNLVFDENYKTPEVAVDYGNKSNYLEGQTTVISSFVEGQNSVQIIKDDIVIEEVEVNGVSKFERTLSKGYYKVKLAGSDEYTEFCVCKPEISYTLDGNVITITASSGDEKSKIHHLDFRAPGDDIWMPLASIQELSDEEIASGIIERKVNKNFSGNFKVSFENEYGIWTHPMIKIEFKK